MTARLADLPAVHELLARPELAGEARKRGRILVRDAVRDALAAARERARRDGAVADADAVSRDALARIRGMAAPAYPEVINATGVLIHTNLGRSPRLPVDIGSYLALEYDLAEGGRGERLAPVVDRLKRYFGTEAAAVVTNNAACLVLLLAAHAAGREVIVSRGELIEIGGSFRLPDIMAAAGARLVEVGCTNRTHLADYEAAVTGDTAAILVVHRSNFHLSGFAAAPPLEAVARAAGRLGLPVWVDQGSGCHTDLAPFGLRHEATVREILAAGADAVLFSGDKLLGAPQAGIVVGSERAVAPLRRHPLRRALRPDKVALAGLAATLDAYLAGTPERVPLYRLLATGEAAMRRRARNLVRRLKAAGVAARAVPTAAVVGGGTTPDQTLASWGIEVADDGTVAARLRTGSPAVVARLEGGRLLADLRAVMPGQDAALAAAVAAAVRGRA